MDGIAESCGVEALSDHLLERIFTFVNPYYGLNNVQAVSKRWYSVSQSAVSRMKRMYNKCNNFAWKLVDEDLNQGHLLTERCSHSACFYPQEHAMYLFGGCTSRFAAFNDLWKFDLSSREWERVIIAKGPLPSAKALASLVVYRDDLILYGGFSKSSMNPIHQTTSFYKEIHLYNRRQNCWEEIFSENTAPHLAGHSVSIIGDFMLVFGGSMGSSYNNNVYVLDIQSRIWNMPSIPGPCPHPRYGQTQILLDNNHLVIIGGCGGPSVMLNDVWMLEFDMDFQRGWKWTQLKVENQELTPPYMWCHRGVKVGSNAVLLSRPIRNHLARGRRRTSRSNSNSNRLSSPDSPSDRRAVAAAFSNVNLTKQPDSRAGSSNLTPRKKPMLLSSKSLDEQDQKQSPYGRESHPSQSSLQVNNAGHGSYLGKSSELHRACSIPAIIVGEIPKLIVTSSAETSQKAPSSVEKKPSDERPSNRQSGSSNDEGPSTSSAATSEQRPANLSLSAQRSARLKGMTMSAEARRYYLSLLGEERKKLEIVELGLDLATLTRKLDMFLAERMPHISALERSDLLDEFLTQPDTDPPSDAGSTRNANLSTGQLKRQQAPASSSKEGAENTQQRRGADLQLPRTCQKNMCVYVLRLEDAISKGTVRWEQLPVEEDAPEDAILFSLVAGRGELILFGGMRTEGGNGMDSLNVGFERHAICADTYILRPRYNEL